MAKSYEKKDIRPPRPKTKEHAKKENFRKPESKSKKEIAEEKSLVTKQHIKEKEKASTKKEKKDLDATQKRESKHPIHKKKGKDVEIKTKKKNIRSPRPKTIQHADKGDFRKPEPKSKDKIAKEKSKKNLEKAKKQPKVSSPKDRHPAHDPDKGGGKQPKKKGAQAAEVDRGGKSSGPKDKRKSAKGKSVRIMKAEKKRRAKVKKDMPTGRSAAASGAAKGKDIAMQRKKYVLGTLKDKPSGKR